jgi:hypothetical protein
MNLKNGGPAFPNITPDMNVDGGPGMTLRDWFAGQVLALVLSQDGSRIAGKLAANAYEIADAMLTERAK